ncbi:MAG: hypothetical protein WDA16_11160 [Candidatus Thermoplasmatota archaeon]
MNRDLVIGIVGAIILVAGMVAVFSYERDAADTNVPGGAGALVNATGPTTTGTVDLGKSAEKLVTMNGTHLRNVTFTLTWKATNGKDTLKLTVSPPAGVPEGAVSEPKDTGTITVTVPIPATDNATLGAGDWKIKVEFTRADAGTPVPLPTAPPGTTDASVAWSVATTYSKLQ